MVAGSAESAQKKGALRDDLAPAEVVAVLSVVGCRPGVRFDDPLVRVTLDGLGRRHGAGVEPAPVAGANGHGERR